jgi:hypothetical protein
MRKLIKQYGGEGTLIFDNNGSAPVSYRIDEFQDFISDGLGGELPGLKELRGSVNHVQGHPNWHPIAFAEQALLTLVMDDGRKLKLYLRTPEGSVQASGGFF